MRSIVYALAATVVFCPPVFAEDDSPELRTVVPGNVAQPTKLRQVSIGGPEGDDLRLDISAVKPPLDQVDGLRSIRKIKDKDAGTVVTLYDYQLMDGSVFSTKDRWLDVRRDLRPWNERSLKHKVAYNVWNFVVVPSATPVIVGLFKR